MKSASPSASASGSPAPGASAHGDVIIVDASQGVPDSDDGGDPEAHLVDQLEALFNPETVKAKGKKPAAVTEEVADDEDDPPDTTPAEDDDEEELAPPAAEDDEEEKDENEDEKDETATPDEKLKLPEKFQARLDKLASQRNLAREERDTLQTQVKTLTEQVGAFEAEPVLLSPTADSPLSNTRNSQELDATEAHWQNLRDWAEENEDGGLLKDASGRETELDRKQVRALRKHAEAILTKHVPERRAFHEARGKHVAEVKKAYPFLLNPNHNGQKFSVELIKSTGLARRPDYELTAGDAYVGRLIRKGLATAVLDSKTGEVKLLRKTPAAAPVRETAKKPVRAESGGPPVQPVGKAGKSGGVRAAIAKGDAEAALEAMYG